MGADVCASHAERAAAGYTACCERPGKPATPTTAERGGEPPPGRVPLSTHRVARCAIRVEPWSIQTLHPVYVRDGAFFRERRTEYEDH